MNDGTYALDDGHEVVRVCLWEATRGVHFMNEEGDIARSELLDEEMGKKVVIAREVLHFHDFGRAPFCPGLLLVSRGRRGRDCHRGWLWSGGGRGEERGRK